MASHPCITVIIICSVLTHSWNPPLFVACLDTSVLLPCCLCSVDGALTESGNCSDVWNVWYSSTHCTTESRGGTRTLIRQNSLLSSFSVRSELRELHNASALAQESATRIQTELHSCFELCLDSREAVVTLDAVARTPQSHEHVLVVSCIGASLLLSTIFTLSVLL